ncbi:MAG: hypothetical protein ACREXM_19370 [Gammaproteobacteria bacterium]
MTSYGNTGDFLGGALAGALEGMSEVLGQSGCYPGIGMRRGTIVFARKPAEISATFNSCGVLKMEFLRLLFRQLSNSYRKLALLRTIGPEAERFNGDLALGGKGELLVLHSGL